jgi:Lrp/AsnC family transcriptional regulator, leucine-responsive regulatory protein
VLDCGFGWQDLLMHALDRIDRQLLQELQTDGRQTNQELADRVRLSPSPCLRRVRALEASGVISRYTAVVSQEAVGLAITAFTRLTLNSHARDVVAEVEDRIRAIPEIVEAYLLAGDDDYLIKIVTPSLRSYEELMRDHLRTIPSLASINTTFTFGVTKEPSPLPIP